MNYSLQATILPSVVVDANLGASAALTIKGMEQVPDLFTRWTEERRGLFAPEWWLAEVVSVIRQHVFRKLISSERAHQAIEDVESLEVTTFSLSFELYHNALNWAEKIGQSRVYDSLYLALAEHLSAELWTADQRLVNSARAISISWVKWIGDTK